MTTYKNINYETTEALRDALNTEFAALTYPYTVKHRIHGQGQLVFVKAPLVGDSLCLTVDFDTAGTRMLALDMLLSRRLLDMPESLADILIEAQTAFKADFEAQEQVKREAQQLAYEQAKVAEKNAESNKKAEEQYQRTKAKMLSDFEALSATVNPKSTADEFYYSLGWLANHVGVVTAKLPDYLGSAFEKHFGSEAPKTLVDGRAKTSGGYAKQWSWEFVASIKKLKDTVVPTYLQDVTSDFSKGIHNTTFVWDLVDNYGFQFGKKQDVNKIRETIPAKYLEFFEAGLNA